MKLLEKFVAFLNYHRRVVAALCAAVTVAGILSALESRPLEGEPVVAAARALAAGHVLTVDDLTTVTVPTSLITGSAVRDPAEIVGTSTTVALDAHQPLTTHAVLRGASANAGFSLVPIIITDDDLRALLRPGQVVTLIVAFDGEPQTVTDEARVVKLPGDEGGSLTATATGSRAVLVEVPSEVAHVVATLGQGGQLGVILGTG